MQNERSIVRSTFNPNFQIERSRINTNVVENSAAQLCAAIDIFVQAAETCAQNGLSC